MFTSQWQHYHTVLFCSHAKQMQISVRKNVARSEVSDCTKALVKVENGNYLQAEWPLGEMPKPERASVVADTTDR